MKRIPSDRALIDETKFAATIHGSDTYSHGSGARQEYIDASIPRLSRIFDNLLKSDRVLDLRGPTLDVASGWGILFPLMREFLNKAVPYSIAEMGGWNIVIDGVSIRGSKFECEKDRLNYADSEFGLACFFDCLEHLVVDPVWTLLEFNRVLRLGGHLALNTPNGSAIYRVLKLLGGENPATESEIKPSAIYQRHNREWTPDEVSKVLECCGFGNLHATTNPHFIDEQGRDLLRLARERGYVSLPDDDFGPELFVVAEKTEHITVDSELTKERRWPAWLYTGFDAYRRRPVNFPIVVSEDYA